MDDPGIVRVFEVGHDLEQIFIASEFIDGPSLGQYVEENNMTFRQTAELVRNIANSLQHAHESRVVHRDLKPGNIILDSTGFPHIADFGLAKRDLEDVTITATGKIAGTPAFMSPEQAAGERNIDCRTDIYSLGVILFRLLTGELPFRGNMTEMIIQAINDEPPSPRTLNLQIPKDLETITLKCLQKQPRHRFSSSNELAVELERFLEGLPIQSRPISFLEKTWRLCKKRPFAALLFLFLFFVLVATPLVIAKIAQASAMEKIAQQKIESARYIQLQSEANSYVLSELMPTRSVGLPFNLSFDTGKSSKPIEQENALASHVHQKLRRLSSRLDRGLFADRVEFEGAVKDLVGQISGSHGNLWQAEWLTRQALYQHIAKGDVDRTIETELILSNVLLKRGRLKESNSQCLETLAEIVRLDGGESKRSAKCHELLARIYLASNELDKAKFHALTAVRLNKQFELHESELQASTLAALSEIYRRLDRLGEARENAMDSLTLRWRLFSDDHPSVIDSLAHLSRLCREAEDQFHIEQKALGLKTASELADVLEETTYALRTHNRSSKESITSMLASKHVLSLKRLVFDSNDLEVAETLAEIGTMGMINGDHKTGAAALEEAISILRPVLGMDHFGLHMLRGQCYMQMFAVGRFREAVELAADSYEFWARRPEYSKDELMEVVSQRDLGWLSKHAGEINEAEFHLLQSIDKLKKYSGGKHHTLALTYSDLALLYRDTDRISESRVFAQKAYEMCSDFPGMPADQVARSRLPVALMLVDDDKSLDDARKIFVQGWESLDGTCYVEHLRIIAKNMAVINKNDQEVSAMWLERLKNVGGVMPKGALLN